MNIKHHARRGIAATTLVASIAVAIGATGAARAENSVPPEPVATVAPAGAAAEESPPDATGDASPPTSAPDADAVASTTSTTVATPTSTTTPPAAIATTTTVPATTTTQPPAVIAQPMAAIAPTAPLSPSATAANASVTLKWLAPSSNGGATVDRYRVQRAPSASGPWTILAEPSTLSYKAIGLTNGTQYSFRIAAHNASGWGPYSAVVNAVPRTVPTAPLSPVATPANASVKLAWTKPASTGGAAISHYVVQRSSNGIDGWTNLGYPAGTSYTALGLTNGTKYYFRIRAYNAAGWSPFSAVFSAVPRTVPSAPLSPVATGDNGFVWATWKAPSSNGGAPIEAYILQRSSNGVDGWVNAQYTNGWTYVTQAPFLTNGTKYYFRVVARNAAGDSAPSAVVSATPRTVPGAPASCTAKQSPSGQYAIVTWQPPSSNGGAPITSYEVSLWRNGVNVDIVSVYPGDPQVGVLTPSGYGSYDVRVRALNTAGYGPACWTTVFMY